MAPKRAASSKKRKSSHTDTEEGRSLSPPARTTKKAKVTAATSEEEDTGLASHRQPTNKVLPTRITFPPQGENTTRIASWNISGLAASQKKGFKYYVEAEDPDVLILTETKVNNEPVDPSLSDRFPYRYWSISERKGYSGTAVLSKHEPLSVDETLPGHPDPSYVKGRIITLEFENYYLVAAYVVNAGQKLKTMSEKKLWNQHFEVYIRDLDKKKPVIWGGDVNVAPTEKDLKNAKQNWNKTAGYTEEETSSFARILNPPDSAAGANKFLDIWRERHPDDRHYTYFSYRFNCRTKGIGWRLDMFVLSERIAERVKMCEIRSEIYGASDHCPVVLEIEGSL